MQRKPPVNSVLSTANERYPSTGSRLASACFRQRFSFKMGPWQRWQVSERASSDASPRVMMKVPMPARAIMPCSRKPEKSSQVPKTTKVTKPRKAMKNSSAVNQSARGRLKERGLRTRSAGGAAASAVVLISMGSVEVRACLPSAKHRRRKAVWFCLSLRDDIPACSNRGPSCLNAHSRPVLARPPISI